MIWTFSITLAGLLAACSAQYTQFGRNQATHWQNFGRNQGTFWRQFDQGSYQSQPNFQPSQQYQNQAPPQGNYQPAPVQQYQQQAPPQQYQQQQQGPPPQYQQGPPPQQYRPQASPPQQYQQQGPPPQQQYQPQQQQYQQQAPPPQQYQPQAPPPPPPQQYQQQGPPPPQPQPAVYQPQAQSYQQQGGQAYRQHVYREQPQPYEQQIKNPYPAQQIHQLQQVQQFQQPQPIQQQFVQQPQIAAPPPPDKFVPYVSDIYRAGTAIHDGERPPPVITLLMPDQGIPEGMYVAEEIIVDGNHPSYIENIEKVQPPQPRRFKTKKITQIQSVVPPPETTFKAPVPEIAPAPVIRRPAPPPVIHRPPPPSAPAPVAAKTSVAAHKTAAASGVRNIPNEVFLECCTKRHVPQPCERICNFDVLSKKTLTGMFLGTDPCPQASGLDLMQCAALDDDHTECCREMGVHETSAGAKCLGFCNMKPGVTFQADVSMLPCWAVLGDIKSCFKRHILETH